MGVPLTSGLEHSPEQPRVEVVFTNLSSFQKRTLLEAVDDWLASVKKPQCSEGGENDDSSRTLGTLPGDSRSSAATSRECGSIMYLLPCAEDDSAEGMAANTPVANGTEGGRDVSVDGDAETSRMLAESHGNAAAGDGEDDVIMVVSSPSSGGEMAETTHRGVKRAHDVDECSMGASAQGDSVPAGAGLARRGTCANTARANGVKPLLSAATQATPADVELVAPGVEPVSFSIDLPPRRGSQGGAREDNAVTVVSVAATSFNAAFEKLGDVPLYGRSWMLKKCTPPLPGAGLLNGNDASLASGADQATSSSSISILEGLKVLPPMAYVDTGAAAASSSPSPSSFTWVSMGASKQGSCFNCGSYGHQLGDCTRPRDAEAIREAKERMQAGREAWSGGRYYEGNAFGDLVPGQLSATLREALGIKDEGAPPPWAGRLRELGYPPGYFADNPIHQLPASGLEIIHGDEADEERGEGADQTGSRQHEGAPARGQGGVGKGEVRGLGDDGQEIDEEGEVDAARPRKRRRLEGQADVKEGPPTDSRKYMALFPGLNAPFPQGWEEWWERATGISRHSIPHQEDAAAPTACREAETDAGAPKPLPSSAVAAAVAAANAAIGGVAHTAGGVNNGHLRDAARDGPVPRHGHSMPLGEDQGVFDRKTRGLPVHKSISSPAFPSPNEADVGESRHAFHDACLVTDEGRHVERWGASMPPREDDRGSLGHGTPPIERMPSKDGYWVDRAAMSSESSRDFGGARWEGGSHTPRTPHAPHSPHMGHGNQLPLSRSAPGVGGDSYWAGRAGRDDRVREGRAEGNFQGRVDSVFQGSPSLHQPSWEDGESAGGSGHRSSLRGAPGNFVPRESPRGGEEMRREDAFVHADQRARSSPWQPSPRWEEGLRGTPQSAGPSPRWRHGDLPLHDSPFPNLPDGPAPYTPPLPRESPRFSEHASQFRSPYPVLPSYPPPETPPPPAHSPGFELREHIHRVRGGGYGNNAADNVRMY
eukprot:jgi/Mesvir1/20829/Mv25035-RA.1